MKISETLMDLYQNNIVHLPLNYGDAHIIEFVDPSYDIVPVCRILYFGDTQENLIEAAEAPYNANPFLNQEDFEGDSMHFHYINDNLYVIVTSSDNESFGLAVKTGDGNRVTRYTYIPAFRTLYLYEEE